MAVVRRNKYWDEVSSYIQSLSHVGFYNCIKSNTLVSLKAGGCYIIKSWRNSMQLIKDRQLEFTYVSIMGSCALRGRPSRLMGMEGGASLYKVKAFQS